MANYLHSKLRSSLKKISRNDLTDSFNKLNLNIKYLKFETKNSISIIKINL